MWTWVLPFGIQAVLILLVLYALVTLTDLENDFLNPIDCAARLNVLVKPEVALLALQTAWLLLTGRLLLALLYAGVLAYCARRVHSKQAFVEATDVIATLAQQKRVLLLRLATHLLLFVAVIANLVQHALFHAAPLLQKQRRG